MQWDRNISAFSGYAGEVVKGFVAPVVWLSVFPIIILYGGVTLLSWVLFETMPADAAGLIVLSVGYLLAGVMIGRFAIGASQGDVNSPLFSVDVSHVDAAFYALRAAVMLLIWEAPLFFIIHNMSEGPVLSPSSLVNSSIIVYISYILTMLVIIGPTITWLLAACTSTFGDIFSSEPWRWVFQTRIRDLPIFYGALIGGWIVFLVLYAVPCGIFATLIAQAMMPAENDPNPFAAMQAMMIVPYLFFLLPAAATPVLIGRLIGAFLQGSFVQDGSSSSQHFSQEISSHSNDDESIGVVENHNVGFTPIDDPPEATIEWVKSTCPDYSDVKSAYVVQYQGEDDSEPMVRIVIEIDEEAKLGEQQNIRRTLVEKSPPFALLFMNHQNRGEITQMGILIYRKR